MAKQFIKAMESITGQHQHELKHFLRVVVKPMNKDKLVAGIKAFWDTVTPEKCTKYINHLHKMHPAVVECQGRASGY